MKRIYSVLIFCFCALVSVQVHATTTIGSTTWCQYNSYADQENVLTIYVSDPGELATAIAGQNFTNVQILHISARERTASLLQLTDEDKAALASVNVKTIEMMRAYVEPYTITNSNVERIILPYNWTKEQVKAVGQANSTSTNFEACISMNDQDAYDQRTGDAALIAYLNKPNTLKDAIMRTWNDTHGYAPLGNTVYQGGGDCTRLKYLTVMGNISARDISSQGTYDENGHYVTNGVPDENSVTYNKNTEGEDYYTAGDTPGALAANTKNLYVLDLRDAYVPNEYAADIVFPYSQMGGSNLREIWMPTDPRFKTIPADYLNINSNYIKQICIPGNIEYIKTRAFAGSGTDINYIWTTGPDANTKYDNGAYFVTSDSDEPVLKYKDNPDPTDPENHDWEEGDDNNFTYGTITLPANLKLIERHAFASSIHVRDLYVLNETAPECHVDAFNSVMYHANNTIDASSIKEEDGVKIITRDAYSLSGYKMMTMLHYPRTTATPNTQRYTDPSREYNISTGERDGNGNMLYFPTHTEFATAHDQGTYGYLWNGWNIERTWYNNEITLGTAGGYYGSISASSGHDTSNGQQSANQFYINNNNTEVDKTVGSFYDVTMSDANLPGGYEKPEGLKDYWTNSRNGTQLYPQAVSTTSNYVYVRDDNGDYVKEVTGNQTTGNTLSFRDYNGSADDGLERYSRKQDIGYYSCPDGHFVQDYSWTKDDAGLYILDGEYTPNTTGGGAYVQDYTWVRDDANGTHYHPLVSTPFPGDQWGNLPNDFNNAADYWYATFSYNLDPNGEGEYVKAHDGNYYTQETLPSYWANDYQTFKNNGTYNRILLGYAQCTNNEEVKNHKAELFTVGDTYALLTSDVKDFVNDQKFARNPIAGEFREYNPSTDEGCDRYDITGNGFVLAVSPADDSKQHYTKSYVANSYREFDSSRDKTGEPLYCYGESDFVSETPITYTVQNDYRGWHQFVLAATAHNSKIPFEPLRSFITDNDWWTICEPYDLRYSDLIKFFGYDRAGFDKKIPYLSKLMYVVRDVENQKITLMFSKNLMEYKEVMADGEGIVHGTIDDQTKWKDAELAADPIILHKGVPYLIRPNMVAEDNGRFNRQFDIYKNQNPDLYNRLKESQEISAGKQFDMIYKGEYTVPAYVVGYDAVDAVAEATVDSKTITNKDGSSFTYTPGKIKYNGKDVNYKVSGDFVYSFVGTFYKSALPQYSYFLGWDSEHNCASFWYSRKLDKDGWNWNNETAIILPNFDTSLEIHQATSFDDPARWQFNPGNKEDNVQDYVKCDDFPSGSAGGAKAFTMDFGATNYNDSEATGIEEIVPATTESETVSVYNVNGVFMGNSVEGLAKGIYIVNGKKYVVK